jgi:hypothetical protein
MTKMAGRDGCAAKLTLIAIFKAMALQERTLTVNVKAG